MGGLSCWEGARGSSFKVQLGPVVHPAQSPEPALLSEQQFSQLIVLEDDHFLAVNKPGWIVCHPSKNGPLSSLAGVARLYLKAEKELHLLSRLDRETSGVVVFGKHRKAARIVQMAIEHRKVVKEYWAICEGLATNPFTFRSDFSSDKNSPVHVKQKVVGDGQPGRCVTHFDPVQATNDVTLFRVHTETGKKHQIRAHAQAAGFPLVGEKLYGRDESLYLEFVTKGWTKRLEKNLDLPRQALHAASLQFDYENITYRIEAPWPKDWNAYAAHKGLHPLP